LKTLGITTEPTYHSPGVWNIGDMVMNETVTLTYIADISVDQKPGLYKDLAWAYGCKFETNCAVNDGNDVVALAVSPGYIDETNHVGTGVNVVKSTQSGATLNPTTGEVLGASTELPATGADEAWLTLAALLFLMGIGLITAGKYARRLHV
jgi:LPXTG-motif cell wall-anchored protein